MSGFNTCLIVAGESGSGKSSVLMGESSEDPGLLTSIMNDVFRRIEKSKFVWLLLFNIFNFFPDTNSISCISVKEQMSYFSNNKRHFCKKI